MYVYVAEHAREEGTHAPGVAASGCMKRGCKKHSSDWRAKPGSPENLHRALASYERTSLLDMAVRRYKTEAHYVAYEMRLDGAPLARQPRLCKDALSWARKQGYEVFLTGFSADVDTPPPSPGEKGHVLWTPEMRAEFDDLWARAPGPLATCGLYLSPKGYRLVQPLAQPLVVEAGERALRLWIERLIEAGVWDNARQVKDWTRNFRTPFHRRDRKPIEPGMVDWSRMHPVEAEVPPAAPVTRRASSARARPTAQIEAFEEECPAEWAHVADAIGAALRGTVTPSWRDCYSGLSGALLERGCPPAVLPALVARAHRVDQSYPEWESYLSDRVGIARSTVSRWCSVDESTGERPAIRGLTFLRKHAPRVAAAIDALRSSGAIDGACVASGVEPNEGALARVLRQLAARGPARVPVAEAVATIEREIAQAYGVVAIAAPPGTGKTHAVIERARHLPVIQGRAAPGSRLAVSAPRHDLAEQTASKLDRSLHLFSPPSLVRGGRPVCVYADTAKGLAAGRQSVRRELCEGRGKNPCDAAEGCLAKDGMEGDANANLVVGVHGLVRELREYAGTTGTLVVDEPGEIVLTERITLDDLETARRYLDAFTSRYSTAIAPALAAFTAWVRDVGAVEAPLVSVQDAVRAAAHMLADDLLEAIDVDPEHLADSVLVAAVGAIADVARSTAPPLEWRSVVLARANPGRAAELGRASRLLDLLWRGLTSKVPSGARIDEQSGERAVTLVFINPDLMAALSHEGPVVILDANAALHVPAITKVLGNALRFVEVAVVDGAPIRRTILATGSATKRAWMPRGVPDWSAIVPALRAALAWANEDTSTHKIALIIPKEVHVGLAYALRSEAPETARLVKDSRVPKKVLDVARTTLAPVLAAFPGQIVTGHYGALEGLNHMADCDATITLLDPRPNLGDEMIKAEYLGLDIDGRLDDLAAAELEQAHGRLRTIHRQRAGRQLHVGGVVPSGWRDVDVRVLPGGRPRNGGGTMGGPAMRDARERAGMGVRELARLLRVSPSTVTRYESGERVIPADVADAVLTNLQSVPETPSKKSSYLGVSGTPSVQCPTRGGFGNSPVEGVSGTVRRVGDATAPRKARRINLASLLGNDPEPPVLPLRAVNAR